MAEITASAVRELREISGAGMMDCKAALVENNGDIQAAVDWLRKKGLSKAAKKAGRVAAEGLEAGQHGVAEAAGARVLHATKLRDLGAETREHRAGPVGAVVVHDHQLERDRGRPQLRREGLQGRGDAVGLVVGRNHHREQQRRRIRHGGWR